MFTDVDFLLYDKHFPIYLSTQHSLEFIDFLLTRTYTYSYKFVLFVEKQYVSTTSQLHLLYFLYCTGDLRLCVDASTMGVTTPR